jgi:hypothetical protein
MRGSITAASLETSKDAVIGIDFRRRGGVPSPRRATPAGTIAGKKSGWKRKAPWRADGLPSVRWTGRIAGYATIRGAMWAALLGAVVGGFFALAGGLSIELRRNRRRQIAAARLVLAEFERSFTEIDIKAVTVEALLAEDKAGEIDPDVLDRLFDDGWVVKPASRGQR